MTNLENMLMENAKNIYQRILGVMQDVDYIQKGDKKVNNQYSFVSHDQVTGALHKFLVKHGIVVVPNVKSFAQDGNRTTICLEVSFVNADKPDDLVKIDYWGYGIDQADKGPGKAISYAFKYACLKMFCLETGDDPDNEPAVVHVPAAPKEMDLMEFVSQIHKLNGRAYDERMGEYIAYLEVHRRVPASKIMEQALKKDLIDRFCNGYDRWLLEGEKA